MVDDGAAAVCHFCFRAFNNRGALGSHLRVHRKEKLAAPAPALPAAAGAGEDSAESGVSDGENDGGGGLESPVDVRSQQLDQLESSDWLTEKDIHQESRHHVPNYAARNRMFEHYEKNCPVQRLRMLDKEYLQASQVCVYSNVFNFFIVRI